jgi:hypothetical protein
MLQYNGVMKVTLPRYLQWQVLLNDSNKFFIHYTRS